MRLPSKYSVLFSTACVGLALAACSEGPVSDIGVTEQTLPAPAGASAAYVSNTLPGTWAPDERRIVEEHAGLLEDELNVKQVRLLDAASEAVDFSLHPYPRQLGQKHGARFPAVRAALLALDPLRTAERLLAGEPVAVEVDGERVPVLPDEVEVRIQAHPGFEAVAEAGRVAALRTEIDEALRREGMAREFIRRVQDQRKALGLHVADRIHLAVHAGSDLAMALGEHEKMICGETLARSLTRAESPPEGAQEISIEGGPSAWVRLTRADEPAGGGAGRGGRMD